VACRAKGKGATYSAPRAQHLDGLWESVFSFKGGRFFWKRPRTLRQPVVISFGAPMPPTSPATEVRQAVRQLGTKASVARGALH